MKQLAEIPVEHFTLFNSVRDGLPEGVVVNDSLLDFKARDLFGWLATISIRFPSPLPSGMPSTDEARTLSEVSDRIETAVRDSRTQLDSQNTIFVSRSTWNGGRVLRYRVHDPERVNQTLSALVGTS